MRKKKLNVWIRRNNNAEEDFRAPAMSLTVAGNVHVGNRKESEGQSIKSSQWGKEMMI